MAGENLDSLLEAIVNFILRHGGEDAISQAVKDEFAKYTGQDTTVAEEAPEDATADGAPAESVPADTTDAAPAAPVAPVVAPTEPAADPTTGETTNA